MSEKVSLVLVSHSAKIAEGLKEMIRQMVDESVSIAACGGDPDGNLGSDVAKIQDAINSVKSPAGVLVLFDVGGTETNAEMAIELLKKEEQKNVILCDAPLVEGAFFAAAEALSGAKLADVKLAALGEET